MSSLFWAHKVHTQNHHVDMFMCIFYLPNDRVDCDNFFFLTSVLEVSG